MLFKHRVLVQGKCIISAQIGIRATSESCITAGGHVKLFILTFMNGLSLAGLYFLVASGFSIVFGLMRNVNLAHGSLFLLGGYIGFDAAEASGSWTVGVLAGTVSMMIAGVLLQVLIFSRLRGDDLRQTLVTIGISIVLADQMLNIWGGEAYQFEIPDIFWGAIELPFVGLKYPLFRLVVLGAAIIVGILLWLLLSYTRIGVLIRAGVDDPEMLRASGANVDRVFVIAFAIGAGLAGMAGVIGGTALSLSPGEDTRYLLASLIVVIVGGMGSIRGAALGALIVAMAENFGLAYSPTYGVVYTFLIMAAVLVFRPYGLLGVKP